jgi:membrane protein DedA with SNARE-associated domain
MSPLRFVLWNVAGGVAWGTAFTLVGYFAGEGYEAALEWAGRGSLAIGLLIAAVVAIFVVKHILVRRLASAIQP